MTDAVVPPSVRAALDYLEYSRMVQDSCGIDGALRGRELTPEEAQARKAALQLLLGYFKRADPTREQIAMEGRQEPGDGPRAQERAPA